MIRAGGGSARVSVRTVVMRGLSSVSGAIDLRSDTVTRPTPAMREAMRTAEVGDDVFGDDPTVLRLEQQCAHLLGKEAAVYVPTGTMANLLGVMTHCRVRSEETILGDLSHVHLYEQGGVAAIAGVPTRVIPTSKDGTLPLHLIEEAIRLQPNAHFPRSKLVCLENTHNRCGGRSLPQSYVSNVAKLCKKHGLALHVDGARLWNCAVAQRRSPSDIVREVDSVAVCLSKGLAAPLGSLLVGNKPFVEEARFLRKALGGGMRQVGVVAATGIVSLNEMIDRLSEDHDNAKRLAEGIAKVDQKCLDPQEIETNIVVLTVPKHWKVANAREFSKVLQVHGVRANATTDSTVRLVTHCDVSSADIGVALNRIKAAIESVTK